MPENSAGPVARSTAGRSAHEGTEVAVIARGDVPAELVDLAGSKVTALMHLTAQPVLLARVKLTQEPDPAREQPAIAQATLDVNGDLVRAQVAARTMRDAIDVLDARLRDKLDHRAEHRQAGRRHDAAPVPGEWRHAVRPSPRADHYDRPADERELVRRKTFATEDLTPDEAAFDMGQLDFDFYLFRDLHSGADCLLEHRPGQPYRLLHTGPATPVPGRTAVPVEVAPAPAPVLTVDEAIQRLDVGQEPHTFFRDADTGRGSVVYRRYDGHYGLIAPS